MDWKDVFHIFLWKNCLYFRYNYKHLLVIFIGCIFVFGLYFVKTGTLLSTSATQSSLKDQEEIYGLYPANQDDKFMYTPGNVRELNSLMEIVRTRLQVPYESLKIYDSVSEMISYLEHKCTTNCFAVHFQTWPNETHPNNEFLYSISSNRITLSPKKRYVNDEEVSTATENDEYIRSGFFTLQYLIDKYYIESRSPKAEYFITVSPMPTSALEFMDSQRLVMFGSLFSILFNVVLLSTFLVPLIEEKQSGLKELLILATPLSFLNGVTFFVIRFVLYIIFAAILLIIAYINMSLSAVSTIFIITLAIIYMLSAMSYTYLISVCFNSVFYAKIGGLLILIVPYMFRFDKGGFSSIATILFSTSTFMEGIEICQIFTNKFSPYHLTINVTGWSYRLIYIYLFLLLQCVVYTLLYYYLSSVFPGPGHLKKPYLFFLQRSFYKKQPKHDYKTAERGTDAIIIQDLEKKFTKFNRTVVVANRLNMTIKNKQITVLLGHNGAGKTTTMGMIIGSVPKDAGKITVCSENNVESYRHLIGFCPQHNIFMEYMTCRQHLKFFAELRGKSKKEASQLTERLLKDLNLEDKKAEYGKNLSGGMKRRLALGIALAGDTKVVILDEPSSGLDVESRRELWDILLELRKTKAVLVSTHHMEEAEVLGDTICILASGCVKISGSPLELKRKRGCGYILKICTKDQHCKQHEILELIQSYIPRAMEVNKIPSTIHISLPYDRISQYETLLKQLEEMKAEFYIDTISITDSSLEEVFLSCADDADQVDSHTLKRQQSKREPYEVDHNTYNIPMCQQLTAISYKKFVFLRREWKFVLFMNVLLFLSIFLAIWIMKSSSSSNVEQKFLLDLESINNGRIYIQRSDKKSQYIAKIVENIITLTVAAKIDIVFIPSEDPIEEKLLKLQNESLPDTLQNTIGVLRINENEIPEITIYFSNNIYHSSVILENVVSNAVLQASTSENNRIKTEYLPIRRYVADVSPTRLSYYATIVPIGCFFYMFFYIALPFRENETNFKSLQCVPALRFWLSTFIFDGIQHSLVCILFFLIQLLIMPKDLYNRNELQIISIWIFLYGISYLPILYIFANICRSISAISTYLLSMFIVSAILPLITSGSLAAMIYYDDFIPFLSILPDFNLNHQLRIINEAFLEHRRGSMIKKENYSKLGHILNNWNFVWVTAAVFIICMVFLITIIENKNRCYAINNFFKCYSCRDMKTISDCMDTEEENLMSNTKSEVMEILNDNEKKTECPLLVNKLYKSYERKTVVTDLNFAVKKKECFGLLGVNGAGKTTTFEMITGNETLNSGAIKIQGVDLTQNETDYRYRFGYCPQYDCLNKYMNSYEMLKFIAQLRNIEAKAIDNEVYYWLEMLDLEDYIDTPISCYSGGTKRKLNTAMAMIGSPPLVLLDEPTTGVDPVSRRFLWKCVQEFQERGKTVVLTSHSMDECEQLCNRLAIMTDGRFKCFGYVPELKRIFGSGFTIKIKTAESDQPITINDEYKMATEYLKKEFENCELRENHAGMLTYFVKSDNIVWSKVFKKMEACKEKFHNLIQYYSVNEVTLEDIFLKFKPKHKKPITEDV